jgi:hypothetical protein
MSQKLLGLHGLLQGSFNIMKGLHSLRNKKIIINAVKISYAYQMYLLHTCISALNTNYFLVTFLPHYIWLDNKLHLRRNHIWAKNTFMQQDA